MHAGEVIGATSATRHHESLKAQRIPKVDWIIAAECVLIQPPRDTDGVVGEPAEDTRHGRRTDAAVFLAQLSGLRIERPDASAGRV